MAQVSIGPVELRAPHFVVMPDSFSGHHPPAFDLIGLMFAEGPVPSAAHALPVVGMDVLEELYFGKRVLSLGTA
jgi:hypothetical protein